LKRTADNALEEAEAYLENIEDDELREEAKRILDL